MKEIDVAIELLDAHLPGSGAPHLEGMTDAIGFVSLLTQPPTL
jgi:hypothetical protein